MILEGWRHYIRKQELRRFDRLISLTHNAYITHMHNDKSSNPNMLDKIRNIGILAHIDAGKTTTTERMLFYSGKTRHMGEVHLGNTVTDYMEQERNRGITITSAAVTFAWQGYRFNLIDTPGHIDFTMEVEQALNVMDGAVIVLDGSAGVEAQTLTVWRQADHYNIPRIVFTNKMDRQDADLRLSLDSLRTKLGVCPLPLFLPIKETGKLVGLVDVVREERCVCGGERGEMVTRATLTPTEPKLYETMIEAREQLTDTLTDLDTTLADTVLQLESISDVTPADLSQALRRVTLTQAGVPVVCGSAYKNVGVQTLMDAVIDYLPSPVDCPQLSVFNTFKDTPSARVFKVIHDKHKGPLSFLRIYSGKLEKVFKLL